MADSRADDCLRQQSRMESERSRFQTVWRDIDDRINPSDAQFGSPSPQEKGAQKLEKVFDATPGLALDRFKAALSSLITPRSQQWHTLKGEGEDLSDDPEIQRYLEEVTRRLFSARYASNFDSEMQNCYGNGGKYGSYSMFVGERPGRGLFYRAVPMKQLYFAENEFGVVDLVHRDWWWTARQCYQRFGEKLPAIIKDAARNRPDQQFRLLHVVKPRADADVGKADHRGMEFVSYYISYEDRAIIEEGGFRTFPYPTGRYDLNPGEVYGRSPCMTIFPDVKMLNAMNQTVLQASQLATLPPLLAARDGVLDAVRVTPGAINYGGLDDQGRQMLQPLQTGANINLGIELMDQKRSLINDALLQTLFQILVDKPNITATEAMLRAQEKGQLIGPTGARIESEFLTKMIEREIDILASAGQLPEMPDQLKELGGLYQIEYDSPLSRMREADGGVAILNTFNQLAPLAQIDPRVFKRINMDASVKELARLNGMPAKLLYTDEEMESIDAAEQQQTDMQQVLEAAPVAASAAKDLANAQAIAASAPSSVLPDIMQQ